MARITVHGRTRFFAVVADGAGSADHAEQGAHLVCTRLHGMLRRWLLRQPADATLLPQPAQVQKWLHHAHTALVNEAARLGASPRQLACTVLGVIAGAEGVTCFQIGDGAIVLCLPAPAVTDDGAGALPGETAMAAKADQAVGPYQVAIWPDNGEYANTTFFVTDDDYADHLHVAIFDAGPTAVALLSDGMQRLALNMAAHSVHEPFFTPFFTRLLAEAARTGHNPRRVAGNFSRQRPGQ
ncbi:MAG: protein phosphatase 2C domain-containing protein [Anaerolineales bacterium]|nr:protein phosphatase 2C domain-containing protein [Anaerolineales bacterium]